MTVGSRMKNRLKSKWKGLPLPRHDETAKGMPGDTAPHAARLRDRIRKCPAGGYFGPALRVLLGIFPVWFPYRSSDGFPRRSATRTGMIIQTPIGCQKDDMLIISHMRAVAQPMSI